MTWSEITTLEELQALVGTPGKQAVTKVRPALHDFDRQWLEASPFCLIGTADEAGSCDVSPKGDPAGQLVHILDDTTIAIAERPGNRRVDGYKNVITNPHVGLIFLVPGRTDTLRINGRARLVSDAPFFDELMVKGHRPLLALVVQVDEVFHHCPKAFMRSALWQPETWTDPLPSRAVIAKTLEGRPESLDEVAAYYGPSYADKLYA